MTQFFKVPGFTLANANFSTKILVTLYLLFTAGGLWIAVLQDTDRAGTSDKDAAEWLLGNEEDEEATEFKVEKSTRELLAITHEHALMMPMLLFVLLHMVALCNTLPDRGKTVSYIVSFVFLGGSFAGMWLVARVDPGWTWLLRWSGVGMMGSMFASCGLVLYELWIAKWWFKRKMKDMPAPANPLFPRPPQGQPGVGAVGAPPAGAVGAPPAGAPAPGSTPPSKDP